MIPADIKLPDISITPSWAPAAHIQSIGRILRPQMSLTDIHERLLDYLMSGRIIEWNRIKGDPKQVALVMLEDRDAKLIRFDGIDFLAYRRPNRIIQFLTLGARR